MTTDRIKEIQEGTACTNSKSVQLALLQVWNECAQQSQSEIDELTKEVERLRKDLPNIDEAGVIAVSVASKVKPTLSAQDEAIFIAGFQECIKYLTTH